MKEEALIIFVRQPQLGKVKTRLAASIGAEAALAIYQRLLWHTCAVSSPVQCDKFVFYADAIAEEDIWNCGYQKRLQADGDLGHRMKAAFAALFQENYRRICIIGSDCLQLTTPILQEAFAKLQNHDVVIGPATDGGYYLLGMRTDAGELFEGIHWSTAGVLEQTKQRLVQYQYTNALLPVLNDIDTAADLPAGFLGKAD